MMLRQLLSVVERSRFHSTSPEPIRFAKRVSQPIRNGSLAYFGVYPSKCENGIPRRNVATEEEDLARRAEKEADRLEPDAGLAIDYAIAAVDQARLAVLDALAGRIRAEETRRPA